MVVNASTPPRDTEAKKGSRGMMGGDVTVASEPGKGSVFTVRLPGSVPNNKDATVAPTSAQWGGPPATEAT